MTPPPSSAGHSDIESRLTRIEVRLEHLIEELGRTQREMERRSNLAQEWLRPILVPIIVAVLMSWLASAVLTKELRSNEPAPLPRPSSPKVDDPASHTPYWSGYDHR
jgi:hypothetical protein